MRTILTICLFCLFGGEVGGTVLGEPKRPYRDDPNDKPRQYVELVEQSPTAYEIDFAGTVDGTMTRMPVGYAAFVQGWQPNRSLLIENVGQSDVQNPFVVVGGKRNWRTVEDVVVEATRGYTSPADRARAIWEFRRRTRFHATTWDSECNDAVKVLNVYGYTLCGNEARVISDLWKAAGLTVRRGYPIGHVVAEVFYDGDYHLLDSDEHVIALERDNRTIASCSEVVRDHDLVKRTHTYGIGRRDHRRTDEFSASLYVYEGERQGDFGTNTRHAMDLTLRPGESIEFRWDHVGKQYTAGLPRAEGEPHRDGLGNLVNWGPAAYDNLRNGKLRYRPDLSSSLADRGAENVDNATFDARSETIEPTDPRNPAAVTWRFACPYVFVGGKAVATVRLGAEALAEWRCSTDREKWQTVASLAKAGTHALTASLDGTLSPRKQPTYEFWLQLVLKGDAAAADVEFDHDIQMAPLSLPELEVGTNRIVYTDSNTAGRRVRITHRWLERTKWHPPEAPREAIAPRDGQTVEGSQVTFRWTPAGDPDGEVIVDYHFELSEHADMRWPLSPNFEKLISLTPFKGKAEWAVPYVGLLNPDTDYFWRVRSRDAAGVWGPWSRTFRFRLKAPGVPLDLKLVPTGEGSLTLAWRPNPQGRPPVAYNVYGSDERGFSVSDTEYLVYRGRGFVKTMEEYSRKTENAPDAGQVKTPANLIARVTRTSLPVVGPELEKPNTNKAYYRVVAVDAAGNRSGPSDYVEVPRPLVVNRPPNARVGQPYRWRPRVIAGLGDLRVRRSQTSSYNAAFWDREEHTFTPVRLPDGLLMDAKTGVITGRPTSAGTFDLAFEVADQFGKREVVSCRLTVAESP